MKKKVLFVYNTHSGKGMVKQHLWEILDTFTKAGYEVIAHPTLERRDATRITQEMAADVDLIVASGGDGTLNEAITGLIRSGASTPIGYIPAGSTNDFGKSLGIHGTMDVVARDIMRGSVFPCDIGRMNDKNFVYIAAFGMFTEVSYETNQNMKNVLGHFAYMLEASKKLFDVPAYNMRLVCDDEEVIEGTFAYGMITNTKSVGGMPKIIGYSVELDDGLFELTLVKYPKDPIEFTNGITSLVFGDSSSPLIVKRMVKTLRVESDQEVSWTVDGEFGGKHCVVDIENLRRKVNIIAKPHYVVSAEKTDDPSEDEE